MVSAHGETSRASSLKIVNVKISHHGLKEYHLPLAHLSYAAYFRYFIPSVCQRRPSLCTWIRISSLDQT